MFSVEELSSDLLTALLILLEVIVVRTQMMLEYFVLELLVYKEISDFKEAPTLRDVLRFATMMSGGQCVMMTGMT